jgi:uncharacterized membrane protein YgcG
MRPTAHVLIKTLAAVALFTSLGVQAAVAVEATVTTTPIVTTPTTKSATKASKQDVAALLAGADLNKQGITHPTKAELEAAVKSVNEKRASGMGWGDIAKSLGLKLGPIVSAANRTERSDTMSGKDSNSNSNAGGNGNGNGGGGGGGGGGGKK